jgi:hypothetical protein
VVNPTNPTQSLQETYSWRLADGRTISHIWDEEKLIREIDGVAMAPEDHGMGHIPFIHFRNIIPRKSFFDLPATDLVEGNLFLNAMLTDIAWTARWQTYGQMIIEGAPPDYDPAAGPETYQKVPKGGSVTFINPNADITSALAVFNNHLKMILAARRIPETAIVAKQIDRSGIAIVAEQASLANWRNRRIQAFREAEGKLIAEAIWQYRFHTSGATDPVPPPQIVHRRLKEPLSAQEQTQWDWEIRNGFATPAEYLVAQDPKLSIEDAEERVKVNLDKTRELQGGMMMLPEDEGLEDEI